MTSRAPGVSAGLAGVVATALAASPEHRYQSAREFRTALRRCRWRARWRPDWSRIERDLQVFSRLLLLPPWRFLWWYLRFFCRRPVPALAAGACLAMGGYAAGHALTAWVQRNPAWTALLCGAAGSLLAAGLSIRWRRR